ncbi:hypothetical protein IY145_17845 [Methylosinus sp. H3A]|uniref:hypothetical protein n=1 Tax=Methylosinus sp. H3A TaxID=2785786 RepID=UPI0018C24AE9|nr:hypothetical protein [Methylosinus sp. H3A]MBG0811221.1 hypothetical protein [Methylosinus sp. H3A]
MAAPSLSRRALPPEREHIARAAIAEVMTCATEADVLAALCGAFPDLPLSDVRTAFLGACVNTAFDERERLILSRTAAALARSIDALPMRRFDPA